ncbi:MAG: N-6 DNA methylase [Elusimicrobia bacterium]|nr:N-6 DNA methylase [Elusimicrobiota bacterium]
MPTFDGSGTPEAIHRRVETLYREALRRWPELNGGSHAPDITPDQLARCLRPLLGWRILESDIGHLDAALERLVARDSKGALGQYFTPRDVIRMCVSALNPLPRDTVIDPACGSGGFLHEAVRFSMRVHGRAPRCLGIDLGAKATKVACLLSHAVGENTIRISRANSIDGREYRVSHPAEWNTFLGSGDSDAEDPQRPWGAWHRLKCSLLLTNPPFAGDLEDPSVLSAYESQRTQRAARKGAVGREHLFVERAVRLLAPGGRLAIVVPQGILANSGSSYLRHWLLENARVLAVVGLHPFAFLPYTGVKTSLLFVEKPSTPRVPPAKYRVLFAVSQAPGKDSSGRAAGPSDHEEIGLMLASFFKAEGLRWAPKALRGPVRSVETVAIDEVVTHDRWDAEYYDHSIRKLYLDVQARASSRLGDLVARSVSRFRRDDGEEIDYIDISSVDPRTGVALSSRMEAREAPSRATYLVESGDVLVSTVRPDRNVVAFIGKTGAVPLVASNGFCVLRAREVPPELLYAYCKTNTFRRLLARHATASMYPAVTDRDVLDMPFVALPPESVRHIVDSIRKGIQSVEDAKQNISRAIDDTEAHVVALSYADAGHPSADVLADRVREGAPPRWGYRRAGAHLAGSSGRSSRAHIRRTSQGKRPR